VTSENVSIDHDIRAFIRAILSSDAEHCNSLIAKGLDMEVQKNR
jgi:hypothetical protein